MNKDIITLDEGLMKKLKELNLKTEKVFKEMHSYRIAKKRSEKIKRI